MANNGNFPIFAFGDCFRICVKRKKQELAKEEKCLLFCKKQMRKLMNKWVLYMAFYQDFK